MDDLVICTGMSVLDIPVRGLEGIDPAHEHSRVKRVGMNLGGDAVNEAVVLTKLGVRTKLYAALSDDNGAKALAMLLDDAGVDRSLCEIRPGTTTFICVPVVLANAERVFISAEKINFANDFAPDPAKIAGARVVTLASLYSQPYTEPSRALAIARAAHEQGSIVIADVTYDKAKGTLDDFAEVWPYVDYFFPNDYEAGLLTGETEPEAMADALLATGMRHVVIKIGRRGCLFKSADECFTVAPHQVEPIDTTGAGDNFCAGFICALLEGRDHRECCRYANAAASICIQHDGASTGIESRAQLQGVLDAY